MSETIITTSGHRALQIEQPLIFELDTVGSTAVDLPAAPNVRSRLGALRNDKPIGLPGLS